MATAWLRQGQPALRVVVGVLVGATIVDSARADSPHLATPQSPPRSASIGSPQGAPGAQAGVGAFGMGSGPGAPGLGDPGAGGGPGSVGGAAGAEPISGDAGAGAGAAGATPPTAPGDGLTSPADSLQAALAARGDTAVGSGGSLGFPVIGDQGPLASLRRIAAARTPDIPNPFPPPNPPNVPRGRGSLILAPSVRSFKIAENQSPRPQDRIYYGLNYFAQVNQTVNERIGSPVQGMKVYRNIFGLEKTFNEGMGSVGIRLPLYTLTGNPRPGTNFSTPTSTALGDLGLYAKYILALDEETGSLISGGLVLSPPTGPSQFAGAQYVNSIHSMQFQPFLGFIWNIDRFYLQGFSAIDIPTDQRDVTLFYNDFSFGYILYRDDDANSRALITAIAPTFEVHVNTPLNHRGAYDFDDVSGTADNVNLTYGLNVEVARNSVATFGIVTPVTAPKPFDFEALFLLNIRFGGSRQVRAFPVLGN